ncbi:hypothetical protein MAP00_004558 [Monascus purpureus]|nr:hypothetical protein MAP00_004558 [Monascus purpureus]
MTRIMVPVGEDAVYCTLLLSDHYLPGAVVLAHSLRDSGTSAKLVALFTPESLRPATIDELKTVYDEVISVHPLFNGSPANLWLMNRPDLISTFTKLELWRQTQFKRIVYLDSDVVALRAPDELLSLNVDFAAAPDVGWPDCFNSGVMVLKPNMQDYHALRALADNGISFDGADQGLLNLHFKNWHRLSFTYNCTPSANYQYIPAYKHFQHSISLVHFIGSQKPWHLSRDLYLAESPYSRLLGKWWTVYDRHYRPTVSSVTAPSHRSQNDPSGAILTAPQNQGSPFTAGVHVSESSHQPQTVLQPAYHSALQSVPSAQQSGPQPTTFAHTVLQIEQLPVSRHAAPESMPHPGPQPVTLSGQQTGQLMPQLVHQPLYHADEGRAPSAQTYKAPEQPQPAILSTVPQYVRGEEQASVYLQHHPYQPPAPPHTDQTSWEPAVFAPPIAPGPSHDESYMQHVQPAAVSDIYEHSPRPSSPKPEDQPPEPPKAEWDASREPPPVNSKPEAINLQNKTYAMSEDTELFQPPESYPDAPKNMYYEVPTTKPEPKKLAQLFPWESHAPRPTRVFLDDEPSVKSHSKQPSISSTGDESGLSQESVTSWEESTTDSWQNYSKLNAWDEVPEIRKYIQSIQRPRRVKTQTIQQQSGTMQKTTGRETEAEAAPKTKTRERSDSGSRGGSVLLTDFPCEIDRPSLPVTPVPIRRPSIWDRRDDTSSSSTTSTRPSLSLAEGVPNQEDWNPLERLEELRRRQIEVLENPNILFERIRKLS